MGQSFFAEAAVNVPADNREKNLPGRRGTVFGSEINFSSLPVTSAVFDGIKPAAISVDVTNLCNLRCKHCFWHSYKGNLPVGTDKRLLDSVENALKRFPSITNITWYGGEPLICGETRSLVEQGLKFRKNNLIMTNGTFPLPLWKDNAHFGVSIDGNRRIYAYLRRADAYPKIRKNILTAVKNGLRVFILYCINSVNIGYISEFLYDWSGKKIAGIGFTAYTPIKGRGSELNLSEADRGKAVFILRHMKRKFGNLITNSETMIELIRGKYGRVLSENCPMNNFNNYGRIYSVHMCNDGTIRVPCALGKDACHADCRSITKIAIYAGKVLRDRESFAALLRMYVSDQNRRSSKLRNKAAS